MIKYFDKGAKLPLWNDPHIKKEALLDGKTGDTGFIDDSGNFKKANIELRGPTTYGTPRYYKMLVIIDTMLLLMAILQKIRQQVNNFPIDQ